MIPCGGGLPPQRRRFSEHLRDKRAGSLYSTFFTRKGRNNKIYKIEMELVLWIPYPEVAGMRQ